MTRCAVALAFTLISAHGVSAQVTARWGGTAKDLTKALVADDGTHVFVVGTTNSPDYP